MSEDTADGRTSAAALTKEIERTRQELGETVEALAAKADVKGRAQQRAAEVAGDLRGKARAARDKVTEQAMERREDAAAAAVGAAAAAAAAVLILAWLAARRRQR